MQHLSRPLLNTTNKVEQTRQLKVEVTDNCAYQDENEITVQQLIVNSSLGAYIIQQDFVILPLHHIHIIVIIDTIGTIHLLLETIRMKGHVDQNQGVSITVRMTSIEDIT